MACHNRAKYVREALQSILDQTYDPLEIIICDDCSTDGTSEVIQETLEEYRKNGGRHEVAYKRNEKNLKILKNYEQCFRMGRGELLITGSDDDIQMPYRVERTVEAWVRGGKKAGLIMCGFNRIDEEGRFIKTERSWGAISALGAANAYVREVVSEFPEFPENDIVFEDHILSVRALMFGPELTIDEPLLSYRFGGGVSTARNYRVRRTRHALHTMESLRMLEDDMRYARETLHPPFVEEAQSLMDRRRRRFGGEFKLVTGRTIGERWRGFKEMTPENGWNLGWRVKMLYYLPFVVPFHLGDYVTKLYDLYVMARPCAAAHINNAVCLLRNFVWRVLSCVVPRDRRLCVAGSWMGEMYGDNPRYLVEYLLANAKVRIVWIGKEHLRAKLPADSNLKFAKIGSVGAAWAALRAGTWIVAQGPCDIGPTSLRGRVTLVNLWHGLAFKRSGQTRADGAALVQQPRRVQLKKWIVNALTRRRNDELGWTSIASDEGGGHLAAALPQYFSTEKMVPFGTPRNDYLIHSKKKPEVLRELKARYAKLLGFAEDRKVVLYLPTFRKPGAKTISFYRLAGGEGAELRGVLDAANAVLLEKPHFLELAANPPPKNGAANWNVVIDAEKSREVLAQELLLVADVLVTDYSSAFVDYCLLGRPCIHFVYDYNEYTTSDAGLAYDIEEIAGGPVVKTLDGLCEVLRNALASGRGEPRPGYAAMVEFEKGRACEQLCERFFK